MNADKKKTTLIGVHRRLKTVLSDSLRVHGAQPGTLHLNVDAREETLWRLRTSWKNGTPTNAGTQDKLLPANVLYSNWRLQLEQEYAIIRIGVGSGVPFARPDPRPVRQMCGGTGGNPRGKGVGRQAHSEKRPDLLNHALHQPSGSDVRDAGCVHNSGDTRRLAGIRKTETASTILGSFPLASEEAEVPRRLAASWNGGSTR
jgi:hypothetical protein